MSRLLLTFLFALIPALSFGWTPPTGVPVPSWPSDLDIAPPSLPDPWNTEKVGYYYVEKSSESCSNTRTYGHPGAPRCKLPASPPPGSVIAVHGTYDAYANITWRGTAASPIWIIAYDSKSKPRIRNYWTFDGSYIIADGLRWRYNKRDGVEIGGDHQMLRNCIMFNPYDAANGAGFIIAGTHFIFYRNTISKMGNWQYTGSADIDRHGIKVVWGATDVWILDSSFRHIHGDGVQVGDQNNAPGQINRIYLGRNKGYENYQSCFWTKNATDVIFSQNICHDISPGEGGAGQGMGGQYDPNHVWFLFNKIYRTSAGIKIAGKSSGGGGPWYAIGNVLYDIVSGYNTCNNYDIGALAYRNTGGFTALYNTLYNVDMFVAIPTGSRIVLRNNIFSNKTGGCTAIDVDVALSHDYNLFSSASYDPGHEPHRVVGDPLFVSADSNFRLQLASPAINAANPVEEAAFAAFQSRYGIDIRKDFKGKPRPAAPAMWDMGAFEKISDGVSP